MLRLNCPDRCSQLDNMFTSISKCFNPNLILYLYYKRRDPYICSAKAPVLEGSGNRRMYPLKGTSVDRVYVVFGARVYLGFFTIRQKRIRGGVRSLKVTARHLNNTGCCYEYTIVSVPRIARRYTISAACQTHIR